jgi:hypothetical protein
MFKKFSSVHVPESNIKSISGGFEYREEDYQDANFELQLMVEDSKSVSNDILVNKNILYNNRQTLMK